MARLKTSKGFLEYKQHMLYFGSKTINRDVMLDNLRVLSLYLDKIDINWGPCFGTLIGIVRNDDFQPWKPVFDIYILKEDEERFKDILWLLMEVRFEVVRYERRGVYYLSRNGEYVKIFVLHKISPDVRHTGGTDFIHERYLQNTVKWDFKGIQLNVPVEVDEYLTFQYGDWVTPKQTVWYNQDVLLRYWYWMKTWVQDHLPDSLYYAWLLNHRKMDFKKFKTRCEKAGIPLPKNVQLANMQPRKYKKILTVGVYDLLHKGHIELYRRAKGLGDYLIVAAQDGDFILKYKPTAKVLNSTEDRKYMIKSIRYVDEVITYTDVDKIVKDVDFDVFVTGPDQCHAGFQRAIRWCEQNGKEHVILARTDGVSSSELKAKIAEKTKNSK
ncbi:adenylyltransferase/cytidyltransferase family protein [Bacteroides ovatus]|uniref:adenylyltransferase/cytidyltransferase family protein n=1 Tax=Bacteroides ovatus TaxID=28116 RepID=UPI00189C4D00|nr:adenylyltransferase/cytidyltransferase family protein [Bacteroides ovatus]MDC2625272.1 adenylyltransferase/cytidyltransferase family protein [Bacteroides ovatus]MDC2639154.1 adenylyltransferase/cytidyltransferase family protein [Bacteroides ovatus]MDC2653522.1 adenylyltransferase/cytidyltransferase family protein [Bacteroides ovatus]